MLFESRLKGLYYDMTLKPVRWLFVVAEFASKTKNKTHANTKFLSIFDGRNNKWNETFKKIHFKKRSWKSWNIEHSDRCFRHSVKYLVFPFGNRTMFGRFSLSCVFCWYLILRAKGNRRNNRVTSSCHLNFLKIVSFFLCRENKPCQLQNSAENVQNLKKTKPTVPFLYMSPAVS